MVGAGCEGMRLEGRREHLAWLNPFSSQRSVLISPLPAPVVRARMAALLTPSQNRALAVQFLDAREARLQGTVWENAFRLSRKANGRNSFQLIASGTIKPSGEGSLLRVRFHLHEAVVLILCVMLGFLALWGALFVSAAVVRSGGSMVLSATLFVLLFYGSVVLLVRTGRRVGDEDAREMRELLAGVLDAREVPV